MRRALFALLLLACLPPVLADEDRASRQAELDAACEAARDEALAPIREEIRAECLAEGKAADFCQRYAAAYNGARGSAAPRFYELPACEAAFEYRRAPRR